MKIALVKSKNVATESRHVFDGGTLRFHRDVQHLRELGVEVEVFYGHAHGAPPIETASNDLSMHQIEYEPSHLPLRFDRDTADGAEFVVNLLRHPAFAPERFDGVWTHHWTSTIGLADAACSFDRWLHTPHLLAHARASLEAATALALRAELETLARCDLVVCLSAFEQTMCARLGSARTIVAPNGVSSRFFAVPLPDARRGPTDPALLTIARLVPQKDLTTLLDAMKLLRDEGSEASLTIVGVDGGDREYEKAVAAQVRELGAAVTCTGRVTQAQLISLHARHRVYVQSSSVETQGMAILEAMAAGRVVVAGRGSAVDEYATDENCVQFAPGDPNDLAAAIQRALVHDRASAWSAAARLTASRYSWDSNRRVLRDVILASRYTEDQSSR